MYNLSMRNIRLTIEYEGTGFAGWQSQAQGERTVQDALNSAVLAVTGSSGSVIAAGRTDSGVHALAHAVSFLTASTLDEPTFVRALNANLPPDVRVLLAKEVPMGFHPIRDAKSKTYVYLIANMDSISPFISRYCWHVPMHLDTRAMKEAAEHFRGSHDFASFMASGSDVTNTVREILDVRCEALKGLEFLGFDIKGDFIRFQIIGVGFLRHMVRNMAGILVDAGKGRLSPSDIPGVIAACSRAAAGPTAPANGLFLKEVLFK